MGVQRVVAKAGLVAPPYWLRSDDSVRTEFNDRTFSAVRNDEKGASRG
jgi:hypothetical protein